MAHTSPYVHADMRNAPRALMLTNQSSSHPRIKVCQSLVPATVGSQDLYGSISKDMAYLFYALAVRCEKLTLYFGKAPGLGAFR